MAAPDHGWRLLRIAELFRALDRREDRVLGILSRVEPGMPPALALTLKRAQIELLHHEVAEAIQLVDQVDELVHTIPVEPLRVAHGDIRITAERILRESVTIDPAAVVLAAKLLDRSNGLGALAEGLRSSDAYTSWEGTNVGGLLVAFRGVSPQRARRISTAAGLAPGADIAECRPDEIVQLADELDRHARE